MPSLKTPLSKVAGAGAAGPSVGVAVGAWVGSGSSGVGVELGLAVSLAGASVFTGAVQATSMTKLSANTNSFTWLREGKGESSVKKYNAALYSLRKELWLRFLHGEEGVVISDLLVFDPQGILAIQYLASTGFRRPGEGMDVVVHSQAGDRKGRPGKSIAQ